MDQIPLHTRMLSLGLAWSRESAGVTVDGRVFDLRKRGIVPLAGKLQGPGVVHDMSVHLELEWPALRIRAIAPTMSAFPFAPGPATRGEGCPDRLPDVQRLVGASLRDAYGPTLTEHIGGPRGCFHIFTMMRLLGPTVEWALAQLGEGAQPGSGPVLARNIIIDGLKGEGMTLALRGTLFDLHYTPGADALPLEEELRASFEAAVDTTVEIPSMAITAAAGRVRRGGPGLDKLSAWEPAAVVEGMVGQAMFKGYTAQVQARFAGSAGLEPLQHLMFMLAPALLQCMPSLAEELNLRPRRAEGPHAAVDSCHMWRAGGPLTAMGGW